MENKERFIDFRRNDKRAKREARMCVQEELFTVILKDAATFSWHIAVMTHHQGKYSVFFKDTHSQPASACQRASYTLLIVPQSSIHFQSIQKSQRCYTTYSCLCLCKGSSYFCPHTHCGCIKRSGALIILTEAAQYHIKPIKLISGHKISEIFHRVLPQCGQWSTCIRDFMFTPNGSNSEWNVSFCGHCDTQIHYIVHYVKWASQPWHSHTVQYWHMHIFSKFLSCHCYIYHYCTCTVQ